MSYNSDLQQNNDALEEILAGVNSLPGGGAATSAPYVVRLTDGNITGNLYYETGETYDTLSDDDKEYIFYGCGTGVCPYFVVGYSSETRSDVFECSENYDDLLAALRNGRTAYIFTDYSVREGFPDFDYSCTPINALVTGFYLTRLGLVAMTPWHWVWFPNGSYHNADTDPYTDTL